MQSIECLTLTQQSIYHMKNHPERKFKTQRLKRNRHTPPASKISHLNLPQMHPCFSSSSCQKLGADTNSDRNRKARAFVLSNTLKNRSYVSHKAQNNKKKLTMTN